MVVAETLPAAIPDGLHFDVPFPSYLQWPLYSQSALKEGRRSMAHLRAALDHERVKEPTDDMVLGSALHVAFLEPELMPTRVALWPSTRKGPKGGDVPNPRKGEAWKAFLCEHVGKIILTESQHAKLIGMVRSLRRHTEVRRWLSKIEHVEVSAVGMVHGLRMKGRCDALTSEPLVDIKKVANGDPGRFIRTVMDYGYDIQGFIYGQLFERDRFLLLCVEDDPPFDVVPYELSPAMIRRGKAEAERLIDQVLECEQSGRWPGRSDVPVMLELPEWAVSPDEASAISIDGEAVFSE